MMYFLQTPQPIPSLQLTEALAEAVSAAAALSVEDQNYLAYKSMEESSQEQNWSASFARSENLSERLAAEALEEERQGKTRLLEELLDEVP